MTNLETLLIAVLIIVSTYAGGYITDKYYKQELVSRGYAQYCPKDGEWAWKGECK